MKTLFNKSLRSVCFIITFSMILSEISYAQTREVNHEFSEFSSVFVKDNLELSLQKSDNYGVKIIVDEALEGFVKAFVKNKRLCLELDKKAIPADVKKMYKKKNIVQATLKAIVYAPDINTIELDDEAFISNNETFKASNLELILKNKSQIRALNVQANILKVKMNKKSAASFSVEANELDLNVSHTANLKLIHKTQSLRLKAENSAESKIAGVTQEIKITASGSSKSVISGNANKMDIKGSNSSSVQAMSLSVNEVTVVLENSSEVSQNAQDKLKVQLTGGSTLIFNGNPSMEIVEIKASTMKRYLQ